jgi:hypothetical protein
LEFPPEIFVKSVALFFRLTYSIKAYDPV